MTRLHGTHIELLEEIETYPLSYELYVKCKKRNVSLKGLTIEYSSITRFTRVPVKVTINGKHKFHVDCKNCDKRLNINTLQ